MQERPNYYAIIPADVRYDKELKDKAKLLYGEIVSLSNKEGYCYASNKYFAELYGISVTTVSLLIKDLIDKNYITSEIIYKSGTKEILNRYLKIVKEGSLKKFKEGIYENLKENNTSINNTRINNILIVEDNKQNIQNSFEKKSQHLSYAVNEVINYMNELANTSFKTTTVKTRKLINARLKEGFSLEELKDVVYYKYNEWCLKPFKFKNGVMSDTYFRPQTLFSNNFESYLQDYQNRYVDGEN